MCLRWRRWLTRCWAGFEPAGRPATMCRSPDYRRKERGFAQGAQSGARVSERAGPGGRTGGGRHRSETGDRGHASVHSGDGGSAARAGDRFHADGNGPSQGQVSADDDPDQRGRGVVCLSGGLGDFPWGAEEEAGGSDAAGSAGDCDARSHAGKHSGSDAGTGRSAAEGVSGWVGGGG